MDKLVDSARIFFNQNPDGSTSIIGNWFTYANLTLSTALFGVTFLIACIATAAYYTLVVVTEPSQLTRRKRSPTIVGSNAEANDLNWFGLSLQNWDFERVLRLIFLAYTTYSTLDLESMECQTKILCQFQEQSGIVGRTTRRISNFLLFFNFFDTFPNIRDYQEAVLKGQRRHRTPANVAETANGTSIDEQESCDTFYPDCQFSMEQFNILYEEVFSS